MHFSRILFLVLLIGGTQILSAQNQPVTRGKATKQATVRVSELQPQAVDEHGQGVKVPNPNWEVPRWTVDEKDVIYREPVKRSKPAQRAVRQNTPAPDTTFQGIPDNGSSIPPDVNGAAGPEHVMVTLNTEVRIQDRRGNELFTTSLSAWWDPMPGNGGTFDPKIVYDPYENRWILTNPSGSNSVDSKLYVAVSATDDPMGEWYMYWINPDEDNITWFDYPNLGFNKKWITVTGNMFGGDFYRTVFVFDKMAMYRGDEQPGFTRFATTEGFTLVPSSVYDTAVENMYLISTSSGNTGGYGYIKKFKLSGPVNNPVFTYEGAIGVPEPWDNGAGWYGNFLPQLGSSEKINSVDSRMETVIYRNHKLWAVHHIFLPAGNPQRTAVQWWSLDTNGVILERGRIDDTTNVFSFAFASIAVNAHEDVFIGHGVFSSTQYASAGYSYKAHYDDSGSMRTYYQYKDGISPYYKTFGGGRNRWGDYTAACVDPVNDIDFWALQEYAEQEVGSSKWGTWWAYLRPSFVPEANFEADETLIPVGEVVNFTDLTAGVPAQWQWQFEGGNPSTDTVQHPKNILYADTGTFAVTLIATNTLGTDTLTRQQYITVSATILPEVDFSADETVVCTGKTVTFTDRTKYLPRQWEWQFDPPTVTFVDGTDATSQHPKVVFDQAGSYAVTLTAWNLNGSSQLTKFDLIATGGAQPWFHEEFEDDGFRTRQWTVENPDEENTWELYQVGGNSPGNTAAGVYFANYFIGRRDRLVSQPLNLEGMDRAFLSFQHAYAKKYEPLSDSLIVYVSPDCGESWTRVFAGGEDGNGSFATHEITDDFWPQTATDWCGSGWGAPCTTIDLAQWKGQANLRLAFETYSAIGNPVFIDNIELSRYVGTEEESARAEELLVYPNPAGNNFTVVLPAGQTFDRLQLTNVLGQVVYDSPLESGLSRISVSRRAEWQQGIYLLTAYGENGAVSIRMVLK